MGRKYAIRDQEAIHFVTFTVVNWIDVFIRDEYKKVLTENLNFCSENKGLQVHAWCIMTSHVHLILSVRENEGFELSKVIGEFKSYSSLKLKEAIRENEHESRREWMLWMFERVGKKNSRNKNFQFWQQHNEPKELSTVEMLNQRMEYTHMNPVVAGFVEDPNHWVWSSCRDYEMEIKGAVDLVML